MVKFLNARFLRTKKKTLACVLLLSLYALMVNINMMDRARMLEGHRELSVGLSAIECEIRPLATELGVSPDATKTLIASYPGSGKRFTWNVISALSNHKIADDWDFSGALEKNTMSIKTSWPHKEGVWSWGKLMDQVLLLVRNPRWAIPSYHSMRSELDYSKNWAESFSRIPYVYTVRPSLLSWESWRDSQFEKEMERWANYIDFWMEGGAQEVNGTTSIHPRCLYSEIECKPQTVVDFDTFYTEHPTSEFFKIGTVLDNTANVEMVSAISRACILDKVYDEKVLHNANRDNHGPVQSAFTFTSDQLEIMYNTTVELRDKYESPPWDEDTLANQLTFILNNYINQIGPEYLAMKAFEEAEEEVA